MQGEPRFLERPDIDYLHDESLRRFGGSAGVRDDGLIESALGSARNAWFYGDGDLFDIAAAYAFHIAEAQAFLDGNKRTAVGAALLFLDLNDSYADNPSEATLYSAMIAIAGKTMNKADFAALFRQIFGR